MSREKNKLTGTLGLFPLAGLVLDMLIMSSTQKRGHRDHCKSVETQTSDETGLWSPAKVTDNWPNVMSIFFSVRARASFVSGLASIYNKTENLMSAATWESQIPKKGCSESENNVLGTKGRKRWNYHCTDKSDKAFWSFFATFKEERVD